MKESWLRCGMLGSKGTKCKPNPEKYAFLVLFAALRVLRLVELKSFCRIPGTCSRWFDTTSEHLKNN